MGSRVLEQIQERIVQERVKKIKKLFPDIDIAQLGEPDKRILPKQLGGHGKRFTIRGKVIYMEKIQNRLFLTLNDGTGLIGVEVENLMLNIEIKLGQILSIVCRLKLSPDKHFYCEARGITVLNPEDTKLENLKGLSLGTPSKRQGKRACRNYWEDSLPVARAKLQMAYKSILILPAIYLIVEPHLFKRLSLGVLGPDLGFILLLIAFLTGRQVIKKYEEV